MAQGICQSSDLSCNDFARVMGNELDIEQSQF